MSLHMSLVRPRFGVAPRCTARGPNHHRVMGGGGPSAGIAWISHEDPQAFERAARATAAGARPSVVVLLTVAAIRDGCFRLAHELVVVTRSGRSGRSGRAQRGAGPRRVLDPLDDPPTVGG